MKVKNQIISLVAIVVFCVGYQNVSAQTVNIGEFTKKFNVITTAVPFLQISPDARAGGMADAGCAISPDANSVHWNAAKLTFAEKKSALSLSSAPWLRTLVPDVWLHYVSGYKQIDNKSAWGASMRYFTLGSIQFTDINGNPLQMFNPSELAVDGAYSRKLSKQFSAGVALRFIYSNLAGNISLQGGQQAKPGIAGAGDLSFYYTTKEFNLNTKKSLFTWGLNISNIGNKITYTNSTNRDFIPINLRTGVSLKSEIDDYNAIMVNLEFTKLLVPTRPQYDSLTGAIKKGIDPNVAVAQGMFQSFYDSPGGFREEMREINTMIGFEYWYAKQFAARAGYFNESPFKGNRRYFTFGIGLRYNVFGLDFAYLIPLLQRNPLENTLRFSLQFNFADGK
ncbi:MAG: type IX secretion system outer membrane channel protein PorV [Flavobacteriaceae bacterium]|nr:type IX secretion system outer membrane channel protein PorV [Flavobacteriaceae bacterium]